MFVIEHGNNLVAVSKNGDDRVKKTFARIFLLPLFIDWIAAMFSDGQHRVDCQLVAA
jgi:hypothetical protein